MSNTCIKLLITTVILNLVSSYRDDGYKYGVKYNLNERKTKQNKGEIWQLSDQYNITNTHVRDSNKGTEIYDGYKGGNMIKGDYSIVPGNADGGEDEGDCRRGGGIYDEKWDSSWNSSRDTSRCCSWDNSCDLWEGVEIERVNEMVWRHGHAHNDYEQEEPLRSALRAGIRR